MHPTTGSQDVGYGTFEPLFNMHGRRRMFLGSRSREDDVADPADDNDVGPRH